jgi:exodeoxyribonuclease-5
MRQAEDDPIVRLADDILNGKELHPGIYGNSAVINRSDININYFTKSDIILCGTNKTRFNINNFCRSDIKKIIKLEYPHIGEKVICRKNNWDKCIDDTLYMTNGTTGYVENIYRDSFNGKTMCMDFRPDFSKKCFKNVTFSYKHMYEIPGTQNDEDSFIDKFNDKMEYAYAITVHSSQGSQWDKVLYFMENMMRTELDRRRLNYTAITRAAKQIVIVLNR